jgi:ABC-type amino acid transport substrate-binding protein
MHGSATSPLFTILALVLSATLTFQAGAAEGDLGDVLARGELRHIGIPYANFVTGSGDGLDVELMQAFAAHLGVKYRFVESNWKDVVTDLTGQRISRDGDQVTVIGTGPIKGDVIANGFTILPWRQRVVDFSEPTFPSGVWLIARADLPINPVQESGDQAVDVANVKLKLRGMDVLAMENTCLDPKLYDLAGTGADVRLYTRSTNLNEMVPAILRNDARTTLLDVPDTLIALEKWPGLIKVVGPVSAPQLMGVAFRKDSPDLRAAFNEFLAAIKCNGAYREMVTRYYPEIFVYFDDFFQH